MNHEFFMRQALQEAQEALLSSEFPVGCVVVSEDTIIATGSRMGMEPCLMCFGAILIHGIGQVVYAYEDVMGGGTGCALAKMPALYKNSKISIISNVLRKESLDLFKAFFSDPENAYWRNSLLAEYTLSQ